MKKLLILCMSIIITTMISGCSNSEPENNKETTVQEDVNESELKDMTIEIVIGSERFIATLEDNETSKALKELLPLTLDMEDINGNEKYYELYQDIKKDTATNPGTIHPGDIMCWGDRGLVLFYETFNNSYSYVKIGQVDDINGYINALGKGNVSITIE